MVSVSILTDYTIGMLWLLASAYIQGVYLRENDVGNGNIYTIIFKISTPVLLDCDI